MALQPTVLARVQHRQRQQVPRQQGLAQVVHHGRRRQRLAQSPGHGFGAGQIQQMHRHAQTVTHQQRLPVQTAGGEQQSFPVLFLKIQQTVRLPGQLGAIDGVALAQRQHLVVQPGRAGGQPVRHRRYREAGSGMRPQRRRRRAPEQGRGRQVGAVAVGGARRLPLHFAHQKPQAALLRLTDLLEREAHGHRALLRVHPLMGRAGGDLEAAAVRKRHVQQQQPVTVQPRRQATGFQLHPAPAE